MKYGVFLPNFGDYFNPRFVANLATKAEKSGWDGFFIWDHLTLPAYETSPFADPWIVLTAVALTTTRIRFGALITPVARRRPWKLAKETVTLDHLSNGRIIFGAGLGTHDLEFANLGEVSSPKLRGQMLDEGLSVLSRLWSGQTCSFKGNYFNVKDTRFSPPTLQQPRIPVWIAGVWPNQAPLVRAASWDGYFPMKRTRAERFLSLDEIKKARQIIGRIRPEVDDFDLIASGYTDRNGNPEKRMVLDYEAAGATWWLEAFDPWRFSSKDTENRILKGPPVG